ncbi:MAG: amidohydrolase family protein, partial [Pseudomonadota bacterium]
MTHKLNRRQVLAGTTALIATAGASASYAQTDMADLVLLNGKVTTMDPARPEATALAARDGKFVAVGSDEEMSNLIGPFAQVIDAQGKRVIPGLNDSHTHAIRGAVNYNLEVRWDGVDSLEEALHLLRQQAERTPDGQF